MAGISLLPVCDNKVKVRHLNDETIGRSLHCYYIGFIANIFGYDWNYRLAKALPFKVLKPRIDV